LDDNPDHVVKDDDLSFQILVGGSLRGKCKLKDSKGYTYTVKVYIYFIFYRCFDTCRTHLYDCIISLRQRGLELIKLHVI
jgi:hypothetical protein